MRICLRNRISAPAIGAGILALAAVTHVQGAQPITAGATVAQAATVDDARSKAAAKSKVKKARRGKSTGTGGTGNGGQDPKPAPAGPPDPGKYL